jgi:hypothetical protein
MRYLFSAFKERTVERLVHGEEKNKKVTLFFVLGVTFLFFCSAGRAGIASAETLSPWWHLTSGAQPTYIQPGQARDELQRITVTASTGGYTLFDQGTGLIRAEGIRAAGFDVGWEPKLVQEALEGMYGTGNVEVTSPCTGTPNSACTEVNNRWEVYEVKFVGGLTDRYVFPMSEDEEDPYGVKIEALVKGRPDGTILVSATNLGDAGTVTCDRVAAGTGKYGNSRCTEAVEPGTGEYEHATPIVLTDQLPAGLTAIGIEAEADESAFAFGKNAPPVECALGSLTCTFTGAPPLTGQGEWQFGTNRYPSSVPPYDRIQMRIAVNVSGAVASEPENEATITGGEAPAATVSAPLTVSNQPIPFGFSSYEMRPEAAGGGLDTQAGSHPFQLTTALAVNEAAEGEPVAFTKDLHFELPPGVIGNPTPFPQCSLESFLHSQCPEDTVVGVSTGNIVITYEKKRLNVVYEDPLYNIEPAVGEPARFGFIPNEPHSLGPAPPILLTTAVRTGGDYGVTVNVANIPEVAEFLSSEVTFWGVPGAAPHNYSRGLRCIEGARYTVGGKGASDECPSFATAKSPPPLLTLPTSCAGPLHTTTEADSWLQPGVFASLANTAPIGTLDGCNLLPFVPEIKVSPDSQQASKPTGLTVDVHVPQEGQLNPEGLAQSNVKNITVTLPDGVTLNPSAADGLQACSANPGALDLAGGQLGSPGDQIGYEGGKEFATSPGVSFPAFTPYLPGSTTALAAGHGEALEPGKDFCPNASKIAEASIVSPLLPKGQTVKGFVYLAAPQNFQGFPENPFGKHVAMYLVAEDPVSGTVVKLAGKVELGGEPGVEGLAAGQIRSTFENNPQLAFEDAELHFFGGERAPLASPDHCGTYTTNATFTPWSGGEPVNSQSSFEITSGPNGSPCPGAALPFSASLASGTTNNNAGGFSSLTTTLSREDGQQNIQSVTLHYPAGLSGLLSGVELCPEAQANAGTCGPNSQIGETIVSVGLGGDPFTVTGGKVYITGPYNGSGSCTVGQSGCAPFGLSIVNPAKAGPFDLKEGRPVVVRAKIEVDQSTAALTVTTDGPGGGGGAGGSESLQYAIPTIIEGFPLQIQHVNVLINRPGFTFNPSNCASTAVTGTINSAKETPTSPEASSPVSVPFQATNCASLKFAPKFTVSTSGKTSKADGASLTAKVTEPSEPFGSQANIHYVKVELPKQLPSRLTTLQKACTAAQFEANPASCPSASVIGHAKVITKLVPVPLEGPVYFVSHGGEAFPSLEVVLQGYGVKIILVGATFISKSGITSTTFKTVPDQPFNTFELVLPEGPYSALGTNKNLCALTHAVTTKKTIKEKVKGKTKKLVKKTTKQVAESLTMPNEFIGQNGAEIHESTKIGVTGCGKAKPAKKAKKSKQGKKRKKK